MDGNPNQLFYDPSIANISPDFLPQSEMFPPPPKQMNFPGRQSPKQSSFPSNIPSLHLPAIILLAFAWLLHTIATFIPYWSVYSGVYGARAGLWSARNFDYMSIQNFYFPEPNTFQNITQSIRFTSANTKGYLVTVQFLMTFNFVIMTILLILLAVDYILATRSPDQPRSVLIRQYNTADTALIYGVLLYILYVFTIFEFAAWITYVGSRHDNNWRMHASFGLAIVVSIFLIVVFAMYVIEFLKLFKKNRLRWEYWYGPYVEWAFFVHLSALFLLLLVICCPEWAYRKYSTSLTFEEIGLFKQCFLSRIYKKTISPNLCTLSASKSNQSWVNATQAFMLMAFIFGTILLIVILVFRKEFRHNQSGYHSDRVSQPTFTFIIAGLILFLCFIFSLIGVSIFGGKVFPNSLTCNWGYILAIFAMLLFLIAGILFILDGVHSGKQASAATASSAQKFFFPEPLSNRVLAMQPLIKPQPAWQPEPPIQPGLPLQPWEMAPPPWQPMAPFDFSQSQLPMYPGPYFDDPSFFPPQQMMMPPPNYAMEPYLDAPIAQATLSNYFRQMLNNPQLSSLPVNQGLGNYSGGNLSGYPNDRNNDNNLNTIARQHFLQQQRLNYNHERLLERYNRLRQPRMSQFRSFGTSSLPGRNYDQYLRNMRGGDDNDPYRTSLAAQSRAGIGSSDETYRWMDNEYYEPLPRYVSSNMQHSRNDPMPFVRAEKFEPVQMYTHPIFGRIPAYIRPVFKRKKVIKKKNAEKIESDHEEERKILTTKNDHHHIELVDRLPLGYVSYKNWKTENNHLIPVNPLLFNIYNQRSKGDIQGYGQSLYVPSGHYNRDRRSGHYKESIAASSLSDTELILDDKLRVPSSKHRYNKLHSQPTVTTKSQELSEHLTDDIDGDLSGDEIRQPESLTALLSRNHSNSLTSHVALPTITTALSGQIPSTMNNAGLIASDAVNIPLTPLKSESVTISNSIVPYHTLSGTYNHLSTVTSRLESKETSSNSRGNNTSLTNDHVIVNSSDNDSDNEKTNKRKQERKKSTTTTDDNGDMSSSSSDV